MTAQHPAAPETETDANGLTEALHRAFHDHWDSPNKPLDLYADSPLWQKQAEAVERIVAERVRVVEGERDDIADRLSALLCDLTGGRMSKTGYSVSTMIQAVEAEFEKHATEDTAALVAEHQWNALERAREADLATARAESAEAAHEAEKAAHERLRAGVERIAARLHASGWNQGPVAARDLRALLPGGGA